MFICLSYCINQAAGRKQKILLKRLIKGLFAIIITDLREPTREAEAPWGYQQKQVNIFPVLKDKEQEWC